jgi:PAS domain S-box-containing protein
MRLNRLSFFDSGIRKTQTGPLITLLVMLLVIYMNGRGIHLRHLDAVFLALVGLSAVAGGTRSGIYSAILTVGLFTYLSFSYEPGLYSPSDEIGARIVILALLAFGTAYAIGYLKRNSDRAPLEIAARAMAEENQRKATFLAEVGTALDEPLEYKATLQRLTELAVPYIADSCQVDVRFDNTIETVASAGTLKHTTTKPFRDEAPDYNETFMQVPLKARGKTLGVLTLSCEKGRRFSKKDLSLALELAGRAALSVDNVLLFCGIQRSHSLLRSAMNSTADGVLVVSLERKLVYHNEKFSQMWRIPAEMIAGTRDDHKLISFVLSQLKYPEDFIEKVNRLATSSEDCLDLIEFKDGRVFERYSQPQKMDGKVIGRVWSFRDVTERKKHESELADLAVENARLYQEAQRAIQARDEFLSVASHELKTPLTSLQLQLQLLVRLGEEAKAREGQSRAGLTLGLISDAEMQCRKMTQLLSRLLDVSKIDAGHLALESEEMDLSKSVFDILERFQTEIRQAKCSVEFQTLTDGRGKWDRTRIEQVVTNLLSNAFKYGSGKAVEIQLTGDDERVTLSIRDHGMGVAPEDMKKIFGRFERARRTRKLSGTGLGLYIVKQIVEAHKGTIRVESELGKGSQFVVTLPRNRLLSENSAISA